MITKDINHLPTNVEFLGTVRCSESEPYCTSVGRRPNGDKLLANKTGAFLIPAGEVEDVAKLLLEGETS